MGAWHPWRELRSRSHITLAFEDTPPGADGMIIDQGHGRRLLVLASWLTRRERRHTLTHELVHDERGLPPFGAPPLLLAKEERAVEQEAVARLVPLDELDKWVRAREESEIPTMVRDVADEFDVPFAVARDAIRHLELARARARHPSVQQGIQSSLRLGACPSKLIHAKLEDNAADHSV